MMQDQQNIKFCHSLISMLDTALYISRLLAVERTT